MNGRRMLFVLAAALLAAACNQGAEVVAPETAPKLGIITIGSGNRSDTTSTQGVTTESVSDSTVVQTSGIITIGSGN